MTHDTQSAQISQKQDEHNIYAIMKIICPPGYHHNGFVATHALGHMMYGSYIYIYIYIYFVGNSTWFLDKGSVIGKSLQDYYKTTISPNSNENM